MRRREGKSWRWRRPRCRPHAHLVTVLAGGRSPVRRRRAELREVERDSVRIRAEKRRRVVVVRHVGSWAGAQSVNLPLVASSEGSREA